MWVFLSLLASVLWSIEIVLDKFVIGREMRDPIIATTLSGVVRILVLLLIVGMGPGSLFVFFAAWMAFVAGFLFSLATLAYWFAIRLEEASRTTAVIATTPIFTAIFAYLVLGETLSGVSYVGVALVVVGAVLVSLRRLHLTRAFLVALLCALFFAAGWIFLKAAVDIVGIWGVLLWFGFGNVVVSLLLLLLFRPKVRFGMWVGIKHLFWIDVLGVIATTVYMFAVSYGPVSLVSALSETKPLIVFLMATIVAYLHPKFSPERLSRAIIIQKSLATLLIVFGALLIT